MSINADELSEWHPLLAKFRTKVRIPTNAGSTQQIVTGSGCLLALVVEETTGSATARFELWDGDNTGGEYMGPWTLSAGQSFDNNYSIYGLRFRIGLFLNVTSGSVGGVAYIGTLVPWPMVHGAGE